MIHNYTMMSHKDKNLRKLRFLLNNFKTFFSVRMLELSKILTELIL